MKGLERLYLSCFGITIYVRGIWKVVHSCMDLVNDNDSMQQSISHVSWEKGNKVNIQALQRVTSVGDRCLTTILKRGNYASRQMSLMIGLTSI